jgi:hypothetical protein
MGKCQLAFKSKCEVRKLVDWFEAVHNMHKPLSFTLTIVFHLPLLNPAKKVLVLTNIGGHLPSLFQPFQVMPKGLIHMDRYHKTLEVKFSYRRILEDASAENVIKLL